MCSLLVRVAALAGSALLGNGYDSYETFRPRLFLHSRVLRLGLLRMGERARWPICVPNERARPDSACSFCQHLLIPDSIRSEDSDLSLPVYGDSDSEFSISGASYPLTD
jgi:hypothetical protein